MMNMKRKRTKPSETLLAEVSDAYGSLRETIAWMEKALEAQRGGAPADHVAAVEALLARLTVAKVECVAASTAIRSTMESA